jgi:hypothetical protein
MKEAKGTKECFQVQTLKPDVPSYVTLGHFISLCLQFCRKQSAPRGLSQGLNGLVFIMNLPGDMAGDRAMVAVGLLL